MGDSAASWLKEWNTVKADCIKRLGKKGKLPKPKGGDPAIRLAKAVAAAKKLDADVQKLLTAVRAHQTNLIFMQEEASKLQKQIADADLGLSLANYDEERIINKVRYEIDKCMSGLILGAETPVKYGFKVRELMEKTENFTDF